MSTLDHRDYRLHELGLVSKHDLDEFFMSAKDGDTVDVVIEGEGRTVPLTLVDRVADKYGILTHSGGGEYGGTTMVLYVISCDNLLYLAGLDPDDQWGYDEDEKLPDTFVTIKGYTVDPLAKTVIADRIESLRDQKVEEVDSLEPCSRFGGWPVDSLGTPLKQWPYYKVDRESYPLVFQAQYQLPDGRMMLVFADGVEALQTVHPMEKDPKWSGDHLYKEGMYGKELFDQIEMLYGRDQWHYENREFVGQKRPVAMSFETWKWEDNGIAVLIEGEDVPSWIEMKEPLEEMKPFLTVSEKAVAFPEGMRHTPSWIQSEKHDAYDYREFLFQIDDGVGGIDFPYGDLGSLYVYWNGKDAGVGSIQCY